jgi:hypothetical protein
MDFIAKAILERTVTPPDFAEDDFLALIRWLQDLYALMDEKRSSSLIQGQVQCTSSQPSDFA